LLNETVGVFEASRYGRTQAGNQLLAHELII